MRIRLARTTGRIKRLAALLLLICFFLPFGESCSNQPAQRESETDRPMIPCKLLLEQPDEAGSWFLLVAFIWPLPMLAYLSFGASLGGKRIARFLESGFCASSCWIFYLTAVLSTEHLLLGAYLALLAIAVYFFAGLVEAARGPEEQSRQTPSVEPS